MPAQNHVENPAEYIVERASWAAADLRRSLRSRPRTRTAVAPNIRRITTADLGASLREGMRDLGVARSDVVFLALFYPLAGLVLAAIAANANLLPLVVPLITGFALLGPIAALGLYQVSRRLDEGGPVSWSTPFEVLRSPALGSIAGLGAILAIVFFAWLATAWGIYSATLGPEPPTSLGSFVADVFGTSQGWAMIVIGTLVGALFAILAFAISAVSFPLMLDRDVGMAAAVKTSVRAVASNPGPMLLWGLILGGGLFLGSLPALVGLIFVMPLFGHASWRLYRRIVGPT